MNLFDVFYVYCVIIENFVYKYKLRHKEEKIIVYIISA